jgi:hypothetical protein
MAVTTNAELRDLFRGPGGTAVRRREDWPRRRQELAAAIVPGEYGGMPPTPAAPTRVEVLHQSTVHPWEGVQIITLRVIPATERPIPFTLYLLVPPGKGPFPVVLNGDGCWRYANDAVAAEVLRRGNILAQFNRVELAADVYTMERSSGLYTVYPEGCYGALSAWAWGYHRCVDALLTLPTVDPQRIAIVGHSRGGKAALLAGATDERIALTCANNSGCGGAGCYTFQGPGSETIADSFKAIGYWYAPTLRGYAGREAELPFDQHFLKAMVAPRALLTCEALGDLWANPTGTYLTHLAAREAYRFLGVESRLGIWFRAGEHDHGLVDWQAFLDFMDGQFRGTVPATRYDTCPFTDLPRAFSWSAPLPE